MVQDENFQEKHSGPGLLSMVQSFLSVTQIVLNHALGEFWTKYKRLSILCHD
jgi:hypothetical protein